MTGGMTTRVLVAGVDSSTQSCKIVIRDLSTGELVRQGRAAHPPGTEIDPELWWTALGEAIGEAGGLADVAAISVAGQQHGMVVLDADGRVIRPALLWNDTRSARAASDLIEEFGAPQYAARTGLVPVASFTSTKLRWLSDAEPENARRVAAVALPHDWLSWRLRGYGPRDESELGPELQELVTDRSDASGTGYWNPSTGAYDLELFERVFGRPARVANREDADTEAVVLPRVLGPHDTAGRTPEGVIVGAGAGDNAAAALGLAAKPGDVIVSIGTSGTVFAVTDEPAVDPTGAVAGFADASGRFLPLVATLNAARVLDSVSELLQISHTALGDLALESPPGSDGLVLLPYFEGERTPNLPDATASIVGMTIASTRRENLARAAIEGMLCGLEAGLRAARSVGVDEQRVLLIGGAAQNGAVQSIAAQVFDARIVVPSPDQYVANGAARQAAWALTEALPEWALSTVAELGSDYRPLIREQYERASAAQSSKPT